MQDKIRYEQFFPRIGNYDLVKATDNLMFSNVLDIGIGEGGASLYFADSGKRVVSLGVNIEGTKLHQSILNHPNIEIFETLFEDFITDEKFDAILMSHVLEHTQNVGLFLQKANELLTDDGWLFVMVPPYKEQVVGGHVTPGWNMGHLMYNLLLSGFNIKNGHYICYGHNICAFVQKSSLVLPKLSMDNGDIEATREYWPESLDVKQGFNGDIERLNWFDNFQEDIEYLQLSKVFQYEAIVNLYNFCKNLDKTKQYVLFGFGSVGALIFPLIQESVKAIIDQKLEVKELNGVKVIKVEELDSEDSVIITPFRYQLTIEKSLQVYTKNLVYIEI